VGAVHAFVAEILGKLIYALEAAHDKALQVELVGYTQVEWYVERVMMGDERTCRRSARYRLQDRGLHLHVAVVVEIVAHRVKHFRALDEDIFHLVVDHEVDITAAVTQLGVVKRVVGDAVFHFYYRERAQRLAQYRQLLGVNRDFTRLGAEYISLYAYEVAYVKQLLEHYII